MLLTVAALQLPAQYPLKQYTVTNSDLAQNTIYDIYKDEQGFAWVSNADKLQLFDGYRFTDIYPPSEPSAFMGKSRLIRTGPHELIVLTLQHGMYLVNSERFSWQKISMGTVRFTATNTVRSYTVTGSDNMVLQVENKLFLFDRQQLRITLHRIPGKFSGYLFPFVSESPGAADNRLLLVDSSSTEVLITDAFTFKTIKHIRTRDTIRRLLLLKDGIIYTNSTRTCIYQSFEGAVKEWQFTKPILDLSACRLADNRLLFCVNGIICYSSETTPELPDSLLNGTGQKVISKGVVRSMLKDGNYAWIASNAEGLIQLQLSEKAFNTLHFANENFNFISGIYANGPMNTILAGTFYSRIIKSDREGQVLEDWSEKLMKSGEVPESCINYFDSTGPGEYLVIGSYTSAWLISGHELISLTGDMARQLKAQHYAEGVIDVRAVVKDRQASYWISQVEGIGRWRLKDRKLVLEEYFHIKEKQPGGFCYRDDKVWFGADTVVYACKAGAGLQKMFAVPARYSISDLEFDAAGRLWISTDKGIVIYDNGSSRYLGLKDGLPNEHIYVIKADGNGYMWCSSNKGLFAISTETLSVRSFDVSDGLQSDEFNTLSFFRHSTGTMFFGGINGISWFNPSSVLKATGSHIVFTELRGNGEVFYKPGTIFPAEISIPYTHSLIELHYSAMNFAFDLHNRYEYRIIENSSEWTANDTKTDIRLLLSPGTYHIEVRLKNEAASTAVLTLFIAPPFYKTWWFYTLVILLFSGLVGAIIFLDQRSKFNRRMSEISAQQKLLAEKERISRDLHDHIGVQANSILYQSELLSLPDAEITRNSETIRDTAKEMIVNLRDTIWAMQKESINGQDIDLRLRNFCHMLKQQYRNFETEFSGSLPYEHTFKYATALNIIRICQEAVFNALKYSACSVITVVYDCADSCWTISIRDTGRGFDLQEKLKDEDHFGLSNMISRAKESGIGLNIDSAPGKGTFITLNIILQDDQDRTHRR